MISKQAISNFLNRKLVTLHKLYEDKDTPAPTQFFHTPPMSHQLIAFKAACDRSFVLLYDTGTGKTKVALDAIRWRLKCGGHNTHALVCVPNIANIEQWREQVNTHAPDLRVVYAEPGWRKADLDGPFDVLVATYASLLHLACVKKAKKKHGKPFGAKMMIDSERMRLLQNTFGLLVLDESTAIMNWRSLIFTVCKKLGASAQWRLCMTATPSGRDPQALWSQFFFADRGKTLGPTLGLFRAAFFTEEDNYWGGRIYTFKHGMTDTLRKILGSGSLRCSINECVSLPEKTYVKMPVLLPEEQHAYYEAALRPLTQACVEHDKQQIELSYMRLRQIASGFIKTEGGSYIDFSPNAKLEAAVDYILGLPEDEKVVVFHCFLHSGDLLQRELERRGKKPARICSTTPDKAAELRRFLEDPTCGQLLGNDQSTSMGLNLQVARYVLFYEVPNSPITRKQAECRVWRQGQHRPVVYTDMFIKGSVEERAMANVREGKNFLEELLSGRGLT